MHLQVIWLVWRNIGNFGMPFFSNTPLAAAKSRRVRWLTAVNGATGVDTPVFNCITSGENWGNAGFSDFDPYKALYFMESG